MNGKKPARTGRVLAAHVMEAELEHLNCATQRPALQVFDAA
jgi:hypothetical protein